MTAVVPDIRTSRRSRDLTVTFGRVVRSEWTKFRSLRSTWWSLAVGVALAVGIGVAASIDAASGGVDADDPVHVAAVSQFGVLFAQLAVLVLAALFVSSEYGTGMIRSSMTVVPRRLPVLLGKATVLVAVVLVVTTVTSVVSFTLGDAIWQSQGHPGASLGDDGVVSVVVGAPLYLAGAAIVALGLGVLLRSTAGAVTTVLGVFFVVPSVVGGVGALAAVVPYLPSNAGGALSHQALAQDPLPGWTGLALFYGYAVVVLALAATRLRRSDV